MRQLPTVSALPLGRGLTPLFAVTIAAQLATLPVVAYHFSQVPLFALVANPLAVPLVGLALPALLCAVAFSIVSTPLGAVFANTAFLPLYGLVALGQFFKTLPLATTAIGGKEWPWCLALVALGMLALGTPGAAFRARSALCAVALAAVLTWHDLIAEKTPVEIAFMDVGQGDAALVRLPEGAVLLVDGGPNWGKTGAGASVIAPAMAAMGLDRVDAVLLSHPDADHLGGLVYVLRHLGVRTILEGPGTRSSTLYREFSTVADSLGITRWRLTAGDSLSDLSGAAAIVLHPPREAVSRLDINDRSLVLRLELGGSSVLLTGDIEAPGEALLTAWGERLRTEILKVPHHGSRTSSTPGFIGAVRPKIAVASVGMRNPYGHPSSEVIERYTAAGADIYRTDLHGAVIIRIKEHGASIHPLIR